MSRLSKLALWFWASTLVAAPAARPFRCAVIGDTGTGGRAQHEVAARLAEFHGKLPFDSVLMLGDNLYGRQKAKDYRRKFELPYAKLLQAGVPFYAVLANHDDPDQQQYPLFHTQRHRYYTV